MAITTHSIAMETLDEGAKTAVCLKCERRVPVLLRQVGRRGWNGYWACGVRHNELRRLSRKRNLRREPSEVGFEPKNGRWVAA